MAGLKQQLSQKMLQKLSPQQIQLMKLLQIPTATLEQRIKEELEANPALEEGDYSATEDNFDLDQEDNSKESDFELDDYLEEYIEDDPMSYKYQHNSSANPLDTEDNFYVGTAENTFHDQLEKQLGMLSLKGEEERILAEHIIGSIDDDGYLRRDNESIVDDLLLSRNIYVDEREVEKTIAIIQQFEPAGIAARDLQECLILQLERKLDKDEELSASEREVKEQALLILTDYFEHFSKKHYDKLLEQMGLSKDELRETLEEILKLNPKPASSISSDAVSGTRQYIIPDFILENKDGELDIRLNSRNAPDLSVNSQYMQMLRTVREHKGSSSSSLTKQDKDTYKFIKNKIDSAKWFIDAIKQRQHTMYKTMYSILQYQYDYFLTGDKTNLKPMILKDIADMTGLDLSTVSRVANSKYIQTEFGTILLKDFFSESITKEDGEEVSTLEVKNILEEIVTQENKKSPLSDEKLRKALKEKGYSIARRTVSKYREMLGIPVARLRKEL